MLVFVFKVGVVVAEFGLLGAQIRNLPIGQIQIGESSVPYNKCDYGDNKTYGHENWSANDVLYFFKIHTLSVSDIIESMNLSAIVLTKNEAEHLARCLKSLDFCDEIIVIDDFSTDNTVEIASEYKVKVFSRHLQDNFAGQRNYGMSKASGDWLLFIDADEVVSDELMQETMVIIMHNSPQFLAYSIKRRDHFLGRVMTHGEVAEVHAKGLVRLIKKGIGQWTGEVHEKFQTDQTIGYLKGYIDHYPHPTLAQFIRKVNYYSTIRANELFEKGQKATIWGIMFTPVLKFIYTYIVKFGFLDGPEGFIYSFFMSFHSFLVRAKLHLRRFAHEN